MLLAAGAASPRHRLLWWTEFTTVVGRRSGRLRQSTARSMPFTEPGWLLRKTVGESIELTAANGIRYREVERW